MKAYKGFNKDMTCRGFQYEEGKEYECDEAKLCETGFHACKYPLDCLGYYNSAESVYHEVEIDDNGERGDDSKIVGKKIKIGARLDIKGIVTAAIEFVLARANNSNKNHSTKDEQANSATGNYSANSATGDGSANSATGNYSANSATGNYSANSATGDGSANSATGYRSANSATGYGSANSATGDGSANSATGDGSANSATGYGSVNVSTGVECANEGAEATLNAAWGRDSKCRGTKGAFLVLSEWGDWDGEKYPLLGAKMIKIDGKRYKENVWYELRDGKIIEAEKIKR